MALDVRHLQEDQALEMIEDAQREIKLGEYLHYKGDKVLVFALTLHEKDLEVLVHYYEYASSTKWTRTLEDFQEKITYENGGVTIAGVPRFTFVRGATNSDILFAMGMLL